MNRKELKFTLTEPVLCESLWAGAGFWVSQCVLPGADPHGAHHKHCQDLCFYIEMTSSLLVGLFDGHGPQGEKVAEFCKEKSLSFVAASAIENPLNFLHELCTHCDTELKESPNSLVDSVHSGCTAVFLYITHKELYSATVGDSRATLARSNSPLQLTKDQKPEEPEEFSRIVQSGGRVQRITDKKGKMVGPYRVWEKTENFPGLAMSRSIGDSSGSKIGIISTPICRQITLDLRTDSFVVTASDGIWDVMSNSEVVSFVEFYREKAARGVRGPPEGAVSFKNACVAQLLCEEARTRWFSLVQREGVLIDDISCVVVELRSSRRPVINRN